MSDAAGSAPRVPAAGHRREVSLVPASSIAGRSLVVVVAIMTFLASLAAGAGVVVAGTARDWRAAVSREMTIQVKPVPGRDLDADAAKAAALARGAEGVAAVDPFDKARSDKLLEPWLGAGLDLGDLPVPRLIVLRLAPDGPFDGPALRARLEAEVPPASLDDHRAWQGRLGAVADALVGAAGVVFALVLTALVFAVAFATRGTMAGNREIVGVLHFVGAEDRYIAREFQRHFLRLGLTGGLAGGGCAGLVFLSAALASPGAGDGADADGLAALFGTFALGPRGYVAIAAIALGTALLTGGVSRAVVVRHLRALE